MPVEPDARAEELREKLAESKTAEPAAEPVVEEPPVAEPESPEERRQRVHEEGRAALDEMKSDDAGPVAGAPAGRRLPSNEGLNLRSL